MNEWISVKDRLPEHYRAVIVHGGVAFYDIGRKKWYTLMEMDGYGEPREIMWTVTHWMPLPKPPEDE